ncbi:unnamed protein product [Candidula unifasciata]|uniref:C2H2-type domain-containing protein n=1 Tax=Candidula unifasciata TaxID=100452 RepID=A0A8S3ZJ00_9EUPU|nr:unnamed protein product [Candidula unifasciata]
MVISIPQLSTGAWWDEQAVVRSSLLQVQAQSGMEAILQSSFYLGPSLASSHSLDSSVACRTCAKTFVSRAHLLKHRHFCAGGTTVTCSECGKTFGRRYNLRVHMRNVHGIGETIACKGCSVIFRSYLKLNEHIQTCHSESKPSAIVDCKP